MLDNAGRKLLRAVVALALVAAASSGQAELLQDVIAKRQLAQDWLDGKVQPDNPLKVTYTGLPFTIRVTSHQPANSGPILNILTPSLRLLEKMSSGKIIAFERYGQIVHPERAGVDAIVADRADFAPCFSVWHPDKHPLMGVLSLPGLLPSTEIATVVSEELYDKYFRQDYENQGVLIGRLKAGSGPSFFSMKPVRTVADLAGLKVGVAGELSRRSMLALGAVPTAMGSNEVARAFMSGAIDAVLMPDAPADVYGIPKAAKYRTTLNAGGHYNAEYCMSWRLWNSLPRDLQIVFNAWLRAQAQAETQILYSVGDARALEKSRAAGLEIIELPADQRVLWAERTRPAVDEWIAAQEAAGRPARQLIEDVKASVQRNQGLSPNDLMRRAINQPMVLNPIKSE